jgi:NAD(P) transhydrogenase
LSLQQAQGACEEFSADHFLIATGSRPYRPADIDFHHKRILDSDKLLELKFTPHSAIIYGAGVIGCEYASMLNNMGIDVTLINTRTHLLEYLDDEITDALSFYLSDLGVRIMHQEEYQRVEAVGHGEDPHGHVEVQLKSGKVVKADVFLFANGRSGNSDDMGLDHIHVKPNGRGQIEVNENLQVKIALDTEAPADVAGQKTGQAAIVGRSPRLAHLSGDGHKFHKHIYAAGDIIGVPALASASYDQGRFAATHIVSGQAEYQLVSDIPTGIYTTPEISSLGKTERQLTEEKVPYVVGKALFRTLARAQITGKTAGMLKILIHRETLEILGIHCFGDNASEIIHIGQAIMAQPAPNNTINFFIHTTFNYPTMAEAYRVAALNGIDRL